MVLIVLYMNLMSVCSFGVPYMMNVTGARNHDAQDTWIILSNKVASEGVTKAIEWYNSDAETRENVHILTSERVSAKEMFDGQGTTDDIKSFVLDEMIKIVIKIL
jgi:hypothetical protein